ncbi:MAG TPA: succinate dehydrogenase, hydrophobic membrane anchor protein [Woeseiaceae bacterium]|jgi:succinate dehydrogenase / fumarate reductase membrane anchor subunit|nr:succinate dehydrogenase, hydrophobic membrane anchor protein [Woeseiaceae bacterium]
MSLGSPLGRVLGLGTAKDGTSHWWGQRVSGVALVLLGLWFAVSFATLPSLAYEDVVAFIRELPNPVLLILLCVTMAYHSYLGVQVVIEDYVHGHGLKVASLILSRFAHIFFAVLGLFSVLRLGIGA